MGELEIVKPWRPKDFEMVWRVYSDGSINRSFFYNTSWVHNLMYDIGAIFPTREAAEAHAQEIQEKMRKIINGELRVEFVEVGK